ncbi:MOSC N-terminal beta barrel domain-containing protein [Kineococcus sp. LSe6-4]|uniref:MOSC N-terminal beta barrel domain-containing protein n=1 Tax=Kineococcus halophytocola TaxID=3234027 RepID=A0ABV4H480_9ACTN
MSVTGVLREIHLFPVKSAGGTSPQTAYVGPDGLVGDRSHAVVDADGEVLAAKRVPRLRELRLAATSTPEVPVPEVPVPEVPVLVVPGGQDLATFLGVPGAHPAPVAGGARQVEAVHVVTRRQRADPAAGDTARANLVLDLDVDPPHGARLRVGAALLEVVGVPRHCGGVFAQVLRPGAVRVGDVVELGVERAGDPHG